LYCFSALTISKGHIFVYEQIKGSVLNTQSLKVFGCLKLLLPLWLVQWTSTQIVSIAYVWHSAFSN